MKLAVFTQRVQVDPHHGERRDCLDQRWQTLLAELGYAGVALPNGCDTVALIDRLDPALVILTGGNTIAAFAPDAADAAPERDALEQALLNLALARNMAVIGVCRGMQMINAHFGGGLRRVDGHAGTRHPIFGANTLPEEVNSYHDWGIGAGDLAPALESLATDAAGNIEALRHPNARIAGIMWHPEREAPYCRPTLDLLRTFL